MTCGVRRRAALLLAGLFVLAASACGSSGGAPQGDDCHWPSTTTPGARGIALALDLDFHRLLAFNAATGALVGQCGAESSTTPVPFRVAGQPVVLRGLQYLRPPVAGATVTALPDNATTEHAGGEHVLDAGGVRDLATGRRHALRFHGWVVTTVVGRRLLLQRYTPSYETTAPADWCVLPSAGAPRNACRPVPGAAGAGTPDVTPAGRIGWIPLAGQPLAIGPARGYAAAGLGGVAGWSNVSGASGIVGADRQTIVFPAGVPGGAAHLSWATVADGRARLHVSAYRNIGSYHLPDATGLAGAFGADGGTSLVLADKDGVVSRFDAGAVRHAVVRLRLPRDTQLGYLLTWPASTGQT